LHQLLHLVNQVAALPLDPQMTSLTRVVVVAPSPAENQEEELSSAEIQAVAP
jgi:hypothetical protein